LEVSPSGKQLLVSGGSGTNGVQTIDLVSKEIVGDFGSQTDVPNGPWAISSTGSWMAYVAKGGVMLCTLPPGGQPTAGAAPTEAGTKRFLLKTDAPVLAIATGIGGEIAVALQDGRVLLWKPDFTPDSVPAWETAPGRRIVTLAFSSDVKSLWTGDERGDLKVRDAASGQWIATLRLQGTKEGKSAPSWVQWNKAGSITKSAE
jgi:hypothetical protein